MQVSEDVLTITGDVCGVDAAEAISYAVDQAEIASCIGKSREARNFLNTAGWISTIACVVSNMTPQQQQEIEELRPRIRNLLQRLRQQNRMSRIAIDLDIQSNALALRDARTVSQNMVLLRIAC